MISLQVSGVVTAEYELEHLLLEGHCFDLSTGQPPRGLQFTLGMSRDPLMYDTIVMANLVSSLLYSILKSPRRFSCKHIDIIVINCSSKNCMVPELRKSVNWMLGVNTHAISTTTGIFPAESQSWRLDPEVT